ncbi:AMP-binding enzyme [Oesophagostomum dentatum]|uniref:long-chain-fatty-acid--CoA ligase n=1 Tax=Oesophagostomum dentatum TaxID=61180 RepID=A0A0B1TQ48_OESDE|nr:AMP-binding enzyme [Oesophagostomum dentatum]
MRIRCSRAFWKDRGIQSLFLDTVRKNPNKEAIYDMLLGKSFTFTELDELACRYGHMLKANSSIQPGDVVGICMENGVHFVAAWLGCAKIGVISAWINTNLQGESLLHSIKISKASVILCSAPYQQKMIDVVEGESMLQNRPLIFTGGTPLTQSVKSTDVLLASQPTSQPTPLREMKFQDSLCYIFTSGTTGMPKPAVIKHFRFFYIATSGEVAFGIKPKMDRIYIALPLYHTSAGVLGIGQTIIHGATCVIREKFSARNFWKDCVLNKCTVSQYIGELLRYLLLAEKSPYEENHCVRLLIGNGLRPAIWRQFQERFKVERIAEFYGSTEGTSNLINIDGKEGSCGFMTIISIAAPIYPIRLFKVDEATGELVRDERGYCIPIKPGESGLLACSIRKNNPLYHFEGYVDEAETQKKIIEEPLPGSNPVFLSGDILYWDRLGYFYFKDRIGDTFRWKGENVSTTQVEAVLQGLTGVHDCTVYGVEVPGCEGKAGMAAVAPSPGVAARVLLTVLYQRFTTTLPPYAVPCFVRITDDIDKTATFKMKKTALQSLGIRSSPGSTVYFLDRPNETYSEVTDTAIAELEKKPVTL